MYFDSLAAALAMDGHGAYVWSAYIITVCVISAMLLGPRRRQKHFLQQTSGELRRQQGATHQDAPMPKEEN